MFGAGPLDLTVVPRSSGWFNGDGDLLAATSFYSPSSPDRVEVEVTPAGEVLIAAGGAVRMIAPANATRFAVAVARESLPALAHRRLFVRTTQSAQLRVSLGQARHRIVVDAQAQAGLTRVDLPREVRWGWHIARIRATSATGHACDEPLGEVAEWALVGANDSATLEFAHRRCPVREEFGVAELS